MIIASELTLHLRIMINSPWTYAEITAQLSEKCDYLSFNHYYISLIYCILLKLKNFFYTKIIKHIFKS